MTSSSRTSQRWAWLVFLVCALHHVQCFSPTPIAPGRVYSTQLFSACPERSCVELIDPHTGCQVVLVGCFHGSPSSGKDVEREVEFAPTDVVALELCASRYEHMMAAPPQQQQQQQQQPPLPTPIRFVQVVANTIQHRGLSTGLATGILGGVSGLQTALSGFTPGLEFMMAVQAAQNQQQQDCSIFLVDQSVDETIEKVGQLPRVVQSMWQETLDKGGSFQNTQWSQMATALRIALAGDTELSEYQVNVGSVVTRHPAAISEMARLMIPPVVTTQIALMAINQALFPEPLWEEEGLVASLLAKFWYPMIHFDPLQTLMDAAPHVLMLSIMFSAAYTFLAVPITQVILSERDDQLTEGIQAACRMAAAKHKNEEGTNGRVVAVLGLLHVNGVAKRLLESNKVVVTERDRELETKLLAE
jgi:hypothetical protein